MHECANHGFDYQSVAGFDAGIISRHAHGMHIGTQCAMAVGMGESWDWCGVLGLVRFQEMTSAALICHLNNI